MIPRVLILLPLLAAVVGLAVRRNDVTARIIAIGSAAVLVLLAFTGLVTTPGAEFVTVATVPGVTLPGLTVPLELATNAVVALLTLIVAVVATAVQVYAAWYLAADDRYPVFAATVSLFTAAMLLLVQSSDLVLTLIGWEVMGWCSYLLIGHWSRTESARRAAIKAYLVTRVADIGFVLGVVGLAMGAGSTGLGDVLTYWIDGPVSQRAALLVLLVIGVLGKSALVPFQDWLPDAMAGPTPASALIHAATMVAAGTVVLASVFPLLVRAEPARWTLGLSAAVTMVLAALLAFAQSDLKRLLAWSTVSQVSIMLGAIASAPETVGPDTGLFHLMSHAVFKALLFLVIGWLAVLAGGTAATALRGSARTSAVAQIALVAGLASLAGVPIVIGGVSKEFVLEALWEGAVSASGPGVPVLLTTLVTIALTAAYATRVLVIATTHAPGSTQRPLAMAWSVRGVLVVLSMLAVVGGLVTRFGLLALPAASLVWLVISVLLIAVGGAVAWRASTKGDPADVLASRLIPYADRGLGADALYRRLVAVPVLVAAQVARFLDAEVIDGYVRGAAVLSRFTGSAVHRAHAGERPSTSIMLVVLGMVVLAGIGVLAWS